MSKYNYGTGAIAFRYRHNPVFNFSVTGDAAHGGLSASAGTPFGNYFMRFTPQLDF